MRLMRFNYTISRVPGNDLLTTDALSRPPIKYMPNRGLEEEIVIYVENVLVQLLAFD